MGGPAAHRSPDEGYLSVLKIRLVVSIGIRC